MLTSTEHATRCLWLRPEGRAVVTALGGYAGRRDGGADYVRVRKKGLDWRCGLLSRGAGYQEGR